MSATLTNFLYEANAIIGKGKLFVFAEISLDKFVK